MSDAHFRPAPTNDEIIELRPARPEFSLISQLATARVTRPRVQCADVFFGANETDTTIN